MHSDLMGASCARSQFQPGVVGGAPEHLPFRHGPLTVNINVHSPSAWRISFQ